MLLLEYCKSSSSQLAHNTSLVLWSTVKMALLGLKADGDPGRLKSPENSWLNKLSSNSGTVERCGREAAETWEQGCKLEIWQFLAATEVQPSKRSSASKKMGKEDFRGPLSYILILTMTFVFHNILYKNPTDTLVGWYWPVNISIFGHMLPEEIWQLFLKMIVLKR